MQLLQLRWWCWRKKSGSDPVMRGFCRILFGIMKMPEAAGDRRGGSSPAASQAAK